jgi:hypothetical protein
MDIMEAYESERTNVRTQFMAAIGNHKKMTLPAHSFLCPSGKEGGQLGNILLHEGMPAGVGTSQRVPVSYRVEPDPSMLTTLAFQEMRFMAAEFSSDQEEPRDAIFADGSPESIIKWGRQCELDDKGQQWAFEIITSSFVLSYSVDSKKKHMNELFPDDRFAQVEAKLKTLAGPHRVSNSMETELSTQGQHLRMLLTGCAGAGKSKVINNFMMYAVKFTHNAGLPLSRHTIRVTALTGCAVANLGKDPADISLVEIYSLYRI